MLRTVPVLANATREVRRHLAALWRLAYDRVLPRRRRGWAIVLVGLSAVALGAGGAAGGGEAAMVVERTGARTATAEALLPPGDTITVWGPQQFNGSEGLGQTYVEQLTATVSPGRLYTLHLVNGAADGTHRSSKVEIKLNGYEIVSQTEVTQAVAELDRTVALTAVDTLVITVAGSGDPYIALSILSTPESSFDVYGPNQYLVSTGSSQTYNESFSVPTSAGPPYRVYVVNGAADGTLRAASASITLNGTEIVTPSELTSGVGSLTKVVSLNASNTLGVTVSGGVNTYLTLRFTATDTTKPTLTITTPAVGTVTNQATIAVTGTISDQTATTVTVNGTAATVTNNTSYSATVPLSTEGSHVLTVVATDASGRHTDSTRTVTRDTQAPSLAVSAPAEGAITMNATITVAATASDGNGVTVNTNGVSLTDAGGGNFSGSVPLNQGSNVLTTTATDLAGNATSVVRNVVRDTVPPALTVTSPAEGATTAVEMVTVSGTVSDLTSVTVTVNGAGVTVTSGSFSKSVTLDDGPNTIAVVATDAAGNTSTVSRTVTYQMSLPPDPSTTAPPLAATSPTSTFAATQFLYTGANAIQTGVSAGTINASRAAVIRGKVLKADGAALPGVTVSVLNHPEFGQTLSRADGLFDLAVNGGEILTLDYRRSGYLPAQRAVRTPWQDYVRADSVALVRLDTAVTTISFAQPIEVAEGTPVTDSRGTRQATLMFSSGTQASMVLPNGTTQPLGSVHVRATEYTVGAMGPTRMPAVLPQNSAYTYAVEFSLDEAQAAGATEVRFTKPVASYTDNFLNMPVGTAVPVGYYDRLKGQWMAEDNGRVIKILSITAGKADLDVQGSGQISSQAALDSLGITEAERQQLATEYAAGKSLWRVRLSHFTLLDYNWGIILQQEIANKLKPMFNWLDEPCLTGGSVIECETQVLGEAIPVVGTPYTLTYRSNRTPGSVASRTVRIPLSGSTLASNVSRILLTVDVAGKRFEREFPALPNQSYTYTWDGRDGYGRQVYGSQPVRIRVGYAYPALRAYPRAGRQSFAQSSGIALDTVEVDELTAVWQEQQGILGTVDSRTTGLGGWHLDVHHSYDPVGEVLFLGDGTRREATVINPAVRAFAGTGFWTGAQGFGGPAVRGQLAAPTSVAVGPNGTVYIADGIIKSVARDGILRNITGASPCNNNEGVPAINSCQNQLMSVAVGPDGSVYFSERANHVVRRIWPNGIVRTIAGRRSAVGYAGDGGPAIDATLGAGLAGLAVGPDGSVYIADGYNFPYGGNHRVRKIDPNGIITTMAGNGVGGFGGEGGPATQASLKAPEDLAVGPDGSLYIADAYNFRIRRVSIDGRISTIAGTGVDGYGTDGVPATSSKMRYPLGLTVAPDGNLYFADGNGCADRMIDPRGIVRTILRGRLEGGCKYGGGGINGPGILSGSHPTDAAVGPDGTVYVSDNTARRVFALPPALPGFTGSDLLVASGNGRELYQFDLEGRHRSTRDALTADTLVKFSYTPTGWLSTITDADGNVTTIERDAQAMPTAIVGPFGQRTVVTVDGNTRLATVSNPAGEQVRLYHSVVGLLDSLVDPRGKVHRFTYDSLGRLTRDDDPAGGFKTLTRTETNTSWTVAIATALGRTTTHRVDQLEGGGFQRRTTPPNGLTTSHTRIPTGTLDSVRVARPDGSTVRTLLGPAQRWGMQAPYPASTTVTTPGGLNAVVTGIRRDSLTDLANPNSLLSATDSFALNGKWSVSSYTVASRRFVQTSPVGRQRITRLDADGRVASVRASGLDSVIFGYNALGQLTSQQIGGRIWSYSYDTKGRLLSSTDPLSRRDSLFYDDADRLVRRVLPSGREIRFGYDSAGNLTSVTPPGRPAHTFRYTPVNLADGYTPPNVGLTTPATTYTYNLDRQLTTIARPDSQQITIGYDTPGRPSTLTFDRGQLGFTYGATSGHLTGVSAPGSNTLAYTYDGPLPKSVTWAGAVAGSVGVNYNNDLRVSSQTVNGANSLSFSYDNDGLLTAVGALGLKRHTQHGLVERDSVNGVLGVWEYDSLGGLLSYTASRSGTTLFQTSYVRDSLERITQITQNVEGTTTVASFTYDTAGRLFEVHRDGQLTASYEYDLNGNRLALTTSNGTLTGTYDAQDRLTSYGSATYTHTSNGELKLKVVGSDTTQYTYDILGNLTQVRLPNGTQIDYVLDGQNRRVGKKVNGVLTKAWLYQGQIEPVAELNGSWQLVSRFVYGTRAHVPDYVVKSGVTYRLISDHLGSVRLVVNTSDGAIAQRLDYDEFGQVTQNSSPGFQPFGYAGGLLDEQTGLARFGARDYDPATGRWTAKDPIQFAGGSANLYSYVESDPVNAVDPSGLDFWITWHEVLGTGYYHALIWWQPGSVPSGSQGRITFGAGFGLCWAPLCLRAGYNRENDFRFDNKGREDWIKLSLPCGVSEQEMLARLIALQNQFMNNADVPYTAYPTLPQRYNSNSYAHGLAEAAGFQPPTPTAPVPGWENPLPGRWFGGR